MDLKESLQAASNLGHMECPFCAVDGALRGVLRTVTTSELNTVMAWAAEADGGESLQRHRVGILSNSIVELNGVDLRGQTVEMEFPVPPAKEGELPGTRRERIPASRYLRDVLIPTWSSDVTQAVLLQYQALNRKAEIAAMKGVLFDDAALEEAIAEAKKRLERLEVLKKNREAAAKESKESSG